MGFIISHRQREEKKIGKYVEKVGQPLLCQLLVIDGAARFAAGHQRCTHFVFPFLSFYRSNHTHIIIINLKLKTVLKKQKGNFPFKR